MWVSETIENICQYSESSYLHLLIYTHLFMLVYIDLPYFNTITAAFHRVDVPQFIQPLFYYWIFDFSGYYENSTINIFHRPFKNISLG